MALVVAALAAAAPQRPSLRLVDNDPVTFSGRAFKPRESVRVAFLEPGGVVLRVRATRAGVFTATFDEMALDRCEHAFVSAVGARGSRAIYKKLPGPMCAVMRTTD